MRAVLYYLGLGFIALFLFATHSKFLFALDPGKETELFVFIGFDAKVILPYIFGAAFGIVTTIVISLLDKSDRLFWLFIISVSIFEMIGVFLYNNTELNEGLWKWFSSVYYALYAGWVIVGYAYISNMQFMHVQTIAPIESNEVKELVDSDLITLREKGKNNKQIAEILHVHPSTISRRMKKLNL